VTYHPPKPDATLRTPPASSLTSAKSPACFRSRYRADMQSLADRAEESSVQKAYLVSCVNSRIDDLQSQPGVVRQESRAWRKVVSALQAHGPNKRPRNVASGKPSSMPAISLPPSCGPCIGLGTGLWKR
jgi:homoaconitase/3-isopropylmalate dehydratase large subunit